MARQVILDRFRVISQAGAGGFGTVYVAWDPSLRRKVAIKCIELSAGLVSDPSSSVEERLKTMPALEEARTAARLSDPNIVAVYDLVEDYDSDPQRPKTCLIMEYIDGITLDQLLRDHGDKITLNVVAAVFSDVAHALEVAHENGVLHLDIKLTNVLIDGQGRAKVVDFGLSQLVNARGFATTGGGTIGYMPPEQMQQGQLDVRTDEWALASVVYEMLVGENPFRAPTLHASMAAIDHAELALPSQYWDSLDEAADDIVFFALDPDPDERYETVTDFAEELLPHLGDVKRGRIELAAIVGGFAVSDEAAEDRALSGEPSATEGSAASDGFRSLPKAVTPRVRSAALRAECAAGAAVVAGSAAAAAAGSFGWPEPVPPAAALAAAALAAAVPQAGALAALVVLGVSLAVASAPLPGVAVVAAACAWWSLSGRASRGAAGAMLAFPLLGAAGIPIAAAGVSGFAPAAAIAAGCGLRVRDAAAACVAGFVALVALAGLAGGDVCGFDALGLWLSGGPDASGVASNAVANPALEAGGSGVSAVQERILAVLAQPEAWGALLGWCGAAAVVSLLWARGTDGFAYAGAVLGAVVVVAVEFAAIALAPDGSLADSADFAALAAPALSAALGAAAACAYVRAFGVPARR